VPVTELPPLVIPVIPVPKTKLIFFVGSEKSINKLSAISFVWAWAREVAAVEMKYDSMMLLAS